MMYKIGVGFVVLMMLAALMALVMTVTLSLNPGDSGVFEAVKVGNTNVISWVVKERGSIDALIAMEHDRGKGTMLHMAAQVGNLRFARALLDQVADVNATNTYSATALMRAVWEGKGEVGKNMITLLLERGADISLTDRHGWTALAHASRAGRASYVELLLNAGADPLPGLPVAESRRVVQLLVEAGAPVNGTNSTGETPLDMLERFGEGPGAKELRRLGGTNRMRIAE